jgi:hypothetical protein
MALSHCFNELPKVLFRKGFMTFTAKKLWAGRFHGGPAWAVAAIFSAGLLFTGPGAAAEQNLLKNPGFEEAASEAEAPPSWATRADSMGKAVVTDKGAHSGLHGIAIPAHSSVEQKIDSAAPGAYLARCWVKSESEQPVTLLLQDASRPWAVYTCVETKVPRGEWVQIEAFCALDRNGSLTLTLGGMSEEFRFYHGVAGEMGAPIIADDFELIRYEPKPPAGLAPLAVWDAKKELPPMFDWSAKDQWDLVESPTHTFDGTPVLQGRHLAGAVRKSDGGLMVYSIQEGSLKPRCVIVPTDAIPAARCTLEQANGRVGIRVSAETGDRSYIAWFTPKGLISVEAHHVSQFQVRDCHLRFGLLPSFAGTDISYAPPKMTGGNEFSIPSTQWFVGLVDGHDSMLVAVWESDAQAVSLGLSGDGEKRVIDSLSIATEKAGFSLSFVERAGLWHEEPLKEDWLGEYVPIGWERPFPASWTARIFVTPGGQPSFREPNMDYSFPMAYAKTRMWGVWFEDWNHYPFFFDGRQTTFHFEKTFIPNGDALIYFLQPAAADLFSPCEIVEQALGQEKAGALFDFDANRIRKLKYSTPDQFMYDRPVCATTTRLSKIKKEEKATVGVDLATHLYEFIRGIRGRIDQYGAFFGQVNGYLAGEKKMHPELRDYISELEGNYISELEGIVAEAQSKSQEIYETPLPSVQVKIDAMKKLLQEGKGDGFDCGDLDVRDTAGSQDDLCRHYNRLVMRLEQTAALKCGESPEKAVIAKYIWDQSRAVLRQPTRWESRRTLYFFEP